MHRLEQGLSHPQIPELELSDEFNECCAQAMAIASILMQVDADGAVQDAAWAIRSLVTRAQVLGEELRRLTGP